MEHNIKDTINQIQNIRSQIVLNQRIEGVSAPARFAGGISTFLICLYLMSCEHSFILHFSYWMLAISLGALFNAVAVLRWFIKDTERDWNRLIPLSTCLPSLLLAAGISIALLRNGSYDMLFGSWIALYGMLGFSSRHFLPRQLFYVNVSYLIAGVSLLIIPGISFYHSIVPGSIILIGETATAIILHLDKTRKL
ncbi:MAG: hypothetical protein HRT89_02205 [Lentisphaeria bacterium]|nr:hypothetical protein [Lentisphaeria bacterium]NQZ66860.1 hypothetical protein [Lentisphaeria bacterium]